MTCLINNTCIKKKVNHVMYNVKKHVERYNTCMVHEKNMKMTVSLCRWQNKLMYWEHFSLYSFLFKFFPYCFIDVTISCHYCNPRDSYWRFVEAEICGYSWSWIIFFSILSHKCLTLVPPTHCTHSCNKFFQTEIRFTKLLVLVLFFSCLFLNSF